jgi:hypothetical protein
MTDPIVDYYWKLKDIHMMENVTVLNISHQRPIMVLSFFLTRGRKLRLSDIEDTWVVDRIGTSSTARIPEFGYV